MFEPKKRGDGRGLVADVDVRVHESQRKEALHGTARDTIPKINRNSFNRSFCGKNATAYGKGVYFAVDARDSIDDTCSRPDSQGNKYMYLARVVVGDFCVGNDTMNVPPPMPATSNLLLYDSMIKRLNPPPMHVIYHDAQAYSELMSASSPSAVVQFAKETFDVDTGNFEGNF